MLALWILLIAAGLYAFFFVAPAVVAYHHIFARKPDRSFDGSGAVKTSFAPYLDQISAARSKLLTDGRSVSLTSRDGLHLHGTYVDGGSTKTAVFLHGYRADYLACCAVQAAAFRREGYNVLLIQHRAHGESGGDHTTLGLEEQFDLLDWVDWVRRETNTEQIVIYGVSMGGTTAAYAADRLDPAAVRVIVVDCGFSSPYDQIAWDGRRRGIPSWGVMPVIRLLAKGQLNVDIKTPVTEALSRTAIPCFFLHGTDDLTVPYPQGVANYESCASDKELFSVPGGGHTVSYMAGGEACRKALFDFVRKHVG